MSVLLTSHAAKMLLSFEFVLTTSQYCVPAFTAIPVWLFPVASWQQLPMVARFFAVQEWIAFPGKPLESSLRLNITWLVPSSHSTDASTSFTVISADGVNGTACQYSGTTFSRFVSPVM